jgi:hypothetical protein
MGVARKAWRHRSRQLQIHEPCRMASRSDKEEKRRRYNRRRRGRPVHGRPRHGGRRRAALRGSQVRTGLAGGGRWIRTSSSARDGHGFPCLDVIIGARPPIRIAFEISCELELKALVLNIEDATIRAIRIGSCRAKGGVKCEGITLIQRETRELDLPARIVLPRGIPIQPLRATALRKSEDRGFRGASTMAPGTSKPADAELPI